MGDRMQQQFYELGSTISFRLPADTPQNVISYLNTLKEKEGRGFSSKIAPLFIKGVLEEINSAAERITIDLPGQLGLAEREWCNNSLSRQILGQFVYRLLMEPNSLITFDKTETTEKKEENNTLKLSSFHSKLANVLLDDDE